MHAGMATVYARFKYVEKMNEGTNVVVPRVNTAALALGLISCLGMVVVATFQVPQASNCCTYQSCEEQRNAGSVFSHFLLSGNSGDCGS